jgi:formate dehydrogenase subunit delta
MSADKLVMMANQIGAFFASQPHVDVEAAIADHLQKFWEPRMRQAILAHLDEGGVGLLPVVRRAVARLRQSGMMA